MHKTQDFSSPEFRDRIRKMLAAFDERIENKPMSQDAILQFYEEFHDDIWWMIRLEMEIAGQDSMIPMLANGERALHGFTIDCQNCLNTLLTLIGCSRANRFIQTIDGKSGDPVNISVGIVIKNHGSGQ